MLWQKEQLRVPAKLEPWLYNSMPVIPAGLSTNILLPSAVKPISVLVFIAFTNVLKLISVVPSNNKNGVLMVTTSEVAQLIDSYSL